MRFALMLINAAILILPLLYTFVAGIAIYLVGVICFWKAAKKYGFNLLIGVDQMANVVLLGFPDETISGRTGRAIRSGKPRWYIRHWGPILDWGARRFGDHNHAEKSIEEEDAFHARRDEELWHWNN